MFPAREQGIYGSATGFLCPVPGGSIRFRKRICSTRRLDGYSRSRGLRTLVCCFAEENTLEEQRKRFYDFVVAPEHPLDLFEALLCIGDGETYSDSHVNYFRRQMDDWASALNQRLSSRRKEGTTELLVLNEFFFNNLGFRMAENEQFYDPKNSLLGEVISRRIGIPITLCVIYRELCHRATDVRLEGVNFPAHFILRRRECQVGQQLYIDPTNERKPFLTRDNLVEKLKVYLPDKDVKLTSDMLTTADEKSIVLRVLRNLKTAYLKNDENEKALGVMDLLVLLSPTSALERRDRGLLLHVMGRKSQCLQDLEFYVALEKSSPDAVVLRALIQRYRSQG